MYNDYQPGNKVRTNTPHFLLTHNKEGVIDSESEEWVWVKLDGDTIVQSFFKEELEIIERLNVPEEWIDEHFDNLSKQTNKE